MKCQFSKDCKKNAVWIIEYLETDEVKALCADHAAFSLVAGPQIVHATNMRCDGPYVRSLKEKLAEKELLKKGSD